MIIDAVELAVQGVAGGAITGRQFRKQMTHTGYDLHQLEERFRYSLRDLADKHVLLVGAGTIGNELAKNLVLSGIQRITIVDFDEYKLENLPRSTLIEPDDLGKRKAEALAFRTAAKSPFAVTVSAFHGDIAAFGFGFLEQFDLIFSPVDNIAARYFINKGALLLGKPHITMGTNSVGSSFAGEAIVIPPRAVACLECVWNMSAGPELAKRLKCAALDEIPDIQPQVMCFSAMVGALASHLGLMALLGRLELNERCLVYSVCNSGAILESWQVASGPLCTLHGEGADMDAAVVTVSIPASATIAELHRAISEATGCDSPHFMLDLGWAELHTIVYNPEIARPYEYIDQASEEPVSSMLIPPDHFYRLTTPERAVSRIIRLRVTGA